MKKQPITVVEYGENIIQPNIILIEEDIRIRKTNVDEWKIAVDWYANEKVMYFSEGDMNKKYSLADIQRMYSYLDGIGELYFIEVFDNKWIPIGDVTLSDQTMPIMIANESYWGLGIGKKILIKLIERAKENGMVKLRIREIYHYNQRSLNLFKSLGFTEKSKTLNGVSLELVL